MTDTPKPNRPDIWKLADAIQMDLRSAQAKLIELRSMLAGCNLPDTTKTTCPTCGVPVKGPRLLAEHIRNSHDGPVPDHWLEIEARSVEPELPDFEKNAREVEVDEEPDFGVPA